MDTSSPVASPSRRTLRVLLALVLLALAPFSWLGTIDRPFLRSTGLTAWILIGAALVLALSAARRDRRAWVRGVAVFHVVVLALFAWGFFVFARLPKGGLPERAPDFTLPDQEGRPVTLASELRKGPVLLVFFRGHW